MPTYRVVYELTDEPGDIKVITLTCLHEVPDDALGDLLPAGVALATDRDLLARIRVRRWRRLDDGRPDPCYGCLWRERMCEDRRCPRRPSSEG